MSATNCLNKIKCEGNVTVISQIIETGDGATMRVQNVDISPFRELERDSLISVTHDTTVVNYEFDRHQ